MRLIESIKKIILILFILKLTDVNGQGAQVPYKFMHPLPTSFEFKKIVSLTDSKFVAFGINSSILTTTNTGQSWQQRVLPDHCTFIDASFCSEFNGSVILKARNSTN